MPTLPDYIQFDGRYWDTGVLRNALDYQGVVAPHTGQPYTEAMLLGISGGVAFGYFTFHYRGYDPQVNLLTRNTFEPMDKVLDRLKAPRDESGTADPEKARQALMDAISDGRVPIVWPDMYLLEYNALEYDENNWMPLPVIVYGYEPDEGQAYIADRACVGLVVSSDELDDARARVKKDRHRLVLIDHPDDAALADAVRAGIQDTITLMLEGPPRGSAKNFGLSGLEHWADALEKTNKDSWAKQYPAGRSLLAVLMSAFYFLGPPFGKTMQAERDTYADFLDEAAAVLNNDTLTNVAVRYRVAGQAWQGLLSVLLPDEVPMLKQARELMLEKHAIFMNEGSAGIARMQQLENAMDNLKDEAERHFPLSGSQVADMRADIRRHVLAVRDAESEAVHALQDAMR